MLKPTLSNSSVVTINPSSTPHNGPSANCIMIYSSKHLCLLLYVGSAWAIWGLPSLTSILLDVTRIESDTIYDTDVFSTNSLWVEGKETTLEIKNSHWVFLNSYLWNGGRTILSANNAIEPGTFRQNVHYHFYGFYNEGLFVVLHEKINLPVFVVIWSVWRPQMMGILTLVSENRGTVILLSNCKKIGKEFLILMLHGFLNLGTMAILGTPAIEARFQILEEKADARFTNTGLIYVKHAVLHQLADFADEGCIVIGISGRLYTRTTFEFGGQRLHFVDGSGALMVDENNVGQDEEGLDRTYYITNFPRGSYVRVKKIITDWKIEGSDFIITNAERHTVISFEGYILDESKVQIEGNLMTYAEDLVRGSPDPRCARMALVMAEARKYEILE